MTEMHRIAIVDEHHRFAEHDLRRGAGEKRDVVQEQNSEHNTKEQGHAVIARPLAGPGHERLRPPFQEAKCIDKYAKVRNEVSDAEKEEDLGRRLTEHQVIMYSNYFHYTLD